MDDAYTLAWKLWKKHQGDFDRSLVRDLTRILCSMNPQTIVHGYHGGNPVCDRPREVEWDKATRWPKTELFVGVFHPEDRALVTCPECRKRMDAVSFGAHAQIGLRAFAKFLDDEFGRFTG